MKFLGAVCLAALVATVRADTALQPSGFSAYANTEFGYGSSMVTFGFPGYTSDAQTGYVADIEAQLHKVQVDEQTKRVIRSEKEIFKYDIADGDKGKSMVMTFAVPDAENDQYYAVRWCKKDVPTDNEDTECSKFSRGSPMKTGTGHTLDCKEFDPSLEVLNVPEMGGLKGYADSRMMGSVSTNEVSTMKIQGFDEMKHRQIMKVGSSGWYAYFVLKVDLSPYKALLQSTVRNSYCARKFQFSVLTHFLKEGEKGGKKHYKVLKTLKFAPYLPQSAAIAMANTTGFPLEIQGKLADNADAQPFSATDGVEDGVIVWHTICFTDKDSAFGAVKCAEPFKPDGESKWEWKKDTITDNGRIGL